MYWKYIIQHKLNIHLEGKRPKTRFDFFFLTLKLLILVTVTETNVVEKPARAEQHPLLMDNKDKAHYKGLYLSN